MVVIDERLGFDTGRIGEHLITVSTILVSTNLSCEHQLEQIGEEVHLCADGLYRIIETGIGILGKINLTIDVTPPNHVLRHALCRWEWYLGTCGKRLRIWLLLLGLLTTCSRLSLHLTDEEGTYHEEHHEHHSSASCLNIICTHHILCYYLSFFLYRFCTIVPFFIYFIFCYFKRHFRIYLSIFLYLTITSMAPGRVREIPSGPTAVTCVI